MVLSSLRMHCLAFPVFSNFLLSSKLLTKLSIKLPYNLWLMKGIIAQAAGHLAYWMPKVALWVVLTQGNNGKHRNNEGCCCCEDSGLMHSQLGEKWPKRAVREKFKIVILIKSMLLTLYGLFLNCLLDAINEGNFKNWKIWLQIFKIYKLDDYSLKISLAAKGLHLISNKLYIFIIPLL